MKKLPLLVLTLFFLSATMLKAQTNQMNILTGVSSTLSLYGTGADAMSFGISTIKDKSDADGFEESDPDKMTSFNFLPKIGVFVIDDLAIGLDLTFAYSSQVDGYDDDRYTRTLLGVGPFIKYYIPTGSVRPFIEMTSSFGVINNKFEYGEGSDYDNEYKNSITSFGINGGMAIPIGSSASFDMSVGYNSLTVKPKEDNEDNERTVIGTLGLKFGFTVFIGNN